MCGRAFLSMEQVNNYELVIDFFKVYIVSDVIGIWIFLFVMIWWFTPMWH